MSLGYLSRVCVRVVQAAVRAEQPASTKPPTVPRPSPAAPAPHRRAWFSGVTAEMQAAAEKTRRAEKDESVMHLICWGPD
ncbi:hypothetical protein ACQ4PT_016594 [Festuca glaucescens]